MAYVAEAKVIHSHNYTGRQQFHRNFDLAVSQAQHPEVFEGVPSEGEGIRMVKSDCKSIWCEMVIHGKCLCLCISRAVNILDISLEKDMKNCQCG